MERCFSITPNVFGLGEGGLVGCSILAECFCPLLPNPCYKLAAVVKDKAHLKTKTFFN
jgi:hypothetical protein